jgi:hypothetical protein
MGKRMPLTWLLRARNLSRRSLRGRNAFIAACSVSAERIAGSLRDHPL